MLLPSGSVSVPPDAALMIPEVVAIVPATTVDRESFLFESAMLVAVIVTVKGIGTVAGAV